MSDAEHDPVLAQVIDDLRRLPAVRAGAVQRVVAAAAAMRVTPPGDFPIAEQPARRWLNRWRAVAIIEAAAIVGIWFAISPSRTSHSSLDARGALPVPQLFLFNNATARRVSVVGDFNEWDRGNAPMTRARDGELWSVTIPILPGRHMYGFIVNDSLFMLDPREPVARDANVGADRSVVIVRAVPRATATTRSSP